MPYRIESDSLGEIQIPDDKLYGAQTQRSINMFKIGEDRFPEHFIKSFALLKKAAAFANADLKGLAKEKAELIGKACDEILEQDWALWSEHFPLVVWQTGSGTQTHMNINEVISHRASQIAASLGSKSRVDSHDDVNISQSSNDVFSAIMHIETARLWQEKLFPAIALLKDELKRKIEAFKDVIKIGRTHMMDATPLTFGQELSGYLAQLEFAEERLKEAWRALLPLPLGGTAVGTGLNSHPRFADQTCEYLKDWTKIPFKAASNRFALIAAHDPLVEASSSLRLLAVVCLKMGNDLRLLASGPRAGFGEIRLPENEPGSSIMPGKVNPTQIEALTMVAIQVMGNDQAIAIAGTQGHLELNTYKPLIIHNLMASTRLLSDAIPSFTQHCLRGIEVNERRMRELLERSLMLVTALNPHLGYDNAAKIARYALENDLSLKESALALKLLTAEQFDQLVRPETMLGPRALD